MLRCAPIVLLAAALAGCGLGAGKTPADVSLTVTDRFGRKVLVLKDEPSAKGEQTVMRLLQRNAKVGTRFGGNFVQAISGRGGGNGIDWFFFVNGSEASKGATAVKVRNGDRVWWDRHDWSAAMDVPAVVGSFPEPFVHGLDGKRLPVRVECSPTGTQACSSTAKHLQRAGAAPAIGVLGTSYTQQTLRVLVGPWPAIREDLAARQLEKGPGASGVFARPVRDGHGLALLDGAGRVTRTLGPGSGLVAALRYQHGKPVWLVTGTDARGVADAADSLDEGVLRNRFALATEGGRPVGLPEVGR